MSGECARPFLKWAGGKTQLLDKIKSRLPKDINNGRYTSYVEPFVGGGAVFFRLAQTYDFQECYIADINSDLYITYTVVKRNVEELIDKLRMIREEFLNCDIETRRDFYTNVRSEFNRTKNEVDCDRYSDAWTLHASRLIFLNKTCFNGLYRVNLSGGFNVPFGKYKTYPILQEEILRTDAEVLQNTEIFQGDFTHIAPQIDENTFVYFDPPYRPLNSTSLFTGYAKNGFDDDEQRRLAAFFAECDAKGACCMLSNSDPKNADPKDEFFDELYAGFNIDRVPAKRMINSDSSKRGSINEIIVTNY